MDYYKVSGLAQNKKDKTFQFEFIGHERDSDVIPSGEKILRAMLALSSKKLSLIEVYGCDYLREKRPAGLTVHVLPTNEPA